MTNNLWHRLALSSILTLSCATAAYSRAELFSDYSFAQAKQKAQQDHKLLLLDFTASWCPPCKKMESSTWLDVGLQAWIKENAIAIQIDVDEDQKTTSSLKVSAMPTIVVFSSEGNVTEFGRQVGFISSSELLRWLKSAKSGKSADQIEKTKTSADDCSVWERISGARQSMMSQKHAEALEQYIWLWNNLDKDDSTFGDVRMKMLPVEVRQLCATYPAANTKWSELRDAADKAGNRSEWIVMNGILNDNARTLAWFDKAKVDPKQHETITKCGALLEQTLFQNCRWTDAVNFLYPDPLATIHEYHKRAEAMKKPGPDTEVSKDFDPLPSMILLVYGAYIGANKEVEAKKIADECLRLDNTAAMQTALDNMGKSMREARAAQSKAVK